MSSALLPTGTWSSYGSLTTLFTAPANCNQLVISYPTATPTITGKTTTSALYQTTATPSTPHLVYYDPVLEPSCYPTQYKLPPLIPTSTSNIPITNSTLLNPPAGYYYPGSCPQGWLIQPYDNTSYNLPTDHTLARCCPAFNRSPSFASLTNPNSPKNKDKRAKAGSLLTHPNNKFFPHGNCDFSLPTLTAGVKSITTGGAIDYYATRYGSITAIAKEGATTTMAAKDWFSQVGTSTGAGVWATGMVVMWKVGDFPDLDADMAFYKTGSATSSMAKATASSKSSAGSRRAKNPLLHPGVLTGNVVGILVSILLCLYPYYSRWKSVRKANPGRVEAVKAKDAKADAAAEKVVYNGRVVPGWFFKFVRKRVVGDGAGKAEEIRQSEEGLLVGPKITNAGIASQQNYGVAEFPPPPYVPGSGSATTPATASASAPAFAFVSVSVSTPAPAPRGPERAWNETQDDFAQRRMDEQREQMLESLKTVMDEQRTQMLDSLMKVREEQRRARARNSGL